MLGLSGEGLDALQSKGLAVAKAAENDSMTDLAALERLARDLLALRADTTKGPWKLELGEFDGSYWRIWGRADTGGYHVLVAFDESNQRNGKFIEAAHKQVKPLAEAVLELVARIRELEGK